MPQLTTSRARAGPGMAELSFGAARGAVAPVLALVVAAVAVAGCSRSGGGEAAKPLPQPAVFVECARCHQIPPHEHDAGPSLWGLAGRRAGSISGYDYSPAMRNARFKWDRERLVAFIREPHKAVPGTRMLFPGLEDPKEAEAVADYLLSLK